MGKLNYNICCSRFSFERKKLKTFWLLYGGVKDKDINKIGIIKER